MTAPLLIAAALVLQAQPARTINEIRVHGNHSTPDARVLELAGAKPGDAFTGATVKAIEDRLRASGQFDRVDVVTRSRSLDGSDLSIPGTWTIAVEARTDRFDQEVAEFSVPIRP